jgi:hypothetical protein
MGARSSNASHASSKSIGNASKNSTADGPRCCRWWRTAGHVGIGAGVSLPLSSVASEDEGRTIVDLGSGVYGERTWSGALEITIERQQELEDVAGRIATSMKEVEATVAQHATAFNSLAEQIEQAKAPTPAPQPNAPQPPESVDDEGEEPHLRARSVRRRFGSELTLDD